MGLDRIGYFAVHQHGRAVLFQQLDVSGDGLYFFRHRAPGQAAKRR